jgi:outer membrane protein assembly factor BamA
MREGVSLSGSVFVCLALASFSFSQEITRAQELEALRAQKATIARPDKRHPAEAAMLWMQERKIQEKLETPGAGFKGWRPRLGGLSTGSGFGFGVLYDRVHTAGGSLDFSLTAATSLQQYQIYQVKADLPRLAGERLFLSTTARHRAMPQEDYFGLGADSKKSDRTDYLYEDTSLEFRGGVRARKWFRAEGAIEALRLNVGKGTDARFVSTEALFTDLNTPGLARQPEFLKSEVAIVVDNRDASGNPRSGQYLAGAYTNYDDRSLNLFDFHRVQAEVQQYLPFNAGHRVIAFRFKTSFDDAKAGHRIPFYLEQSLGGSNDLRGFREFRFRDKNQMVSNLEYRWEAFSGLDMAIFGDAGKVFNKRSEFNLDNLETSYGFGFRFNTAKAVVWRIDIARSREGLRVFTKFDHVF